ncbi:MAG: hybrid-cluster NAD(P)-dependent oxidoreductase [Mesorhizobium sp.]|nr:MAG: hybrid-cluster NAD(P)-dependent oxidoreductase [Mesorhizobium sp.]TJU93803.1 MAG: hybrid-cluster NAD(P)-dependent oxidoreductase [Mesorhizobium sp.]TJV13396.1 MAG: hybrid-cluster NAD(P)-dependent oxidoreductase [Mesorhizobium sp.]
MMNAHVAFGASDFLPMMRDRQWANTTPQLVLCRRVIEETPDVKTFVFTSPTDRMFCFSAGQYLLMHLKIEGTAVTRSYSVSSPPTRPLDIQITVKRTPGGLVSNWLHDNLRPGDEIEIEGPLGSFNLDDLPYEKLLFLSGGSGITPVMSMLRALTDRATDQDISFVHSARTQGDIIFRRELDALASRFPNVRVNCVCSQEDPNWSGPTGRIDSRMLLTLVPDLRDRTVFACGPEAYMKAARACLDAIGVAESRYRQESFGGSSSPQFEPASTMPSSVRFVRSGVAHNCLPGETLLDAAGQCGVYVPTACQQGVCGTCRIAKLSGEVAMDDLGGLTTEEKLTGYVLACCSRPQGAVSLDL